jgi:Ca2+-binding EF-hand superfamily protein
VWSVGVIVFMLHSGSLLFQGSEDELRKAIQRGVEWDVVKLEVSAEAMDFTKGLLVVDPFHRMSALEAIRHQWLAPCLPRDVLDVKLVELMQRYVLGTPLRRALLQYLTLVLPLNAHIRAAFLSLDEYGEGTVRFQVLKNAIRRTVRQSHLKTWATTENILELFRVMDTNGDEQIYYSDFFAATIECTAEVQDRLVHAVFHRFEKQADGSILREGIQGLLGKRFEGRSTLNLLRDVVPPNLPITEERLKDMLMGYVNL